jgi:hypothetical protein
MTEPRCKTASEPKSIKEELSQFCYEQPNSKFNILNSPLIDSIE